MVQSGPGLGDGGSIAQHADASVDRGESAVVGRGGWDAHGLLVVDAELEACGTPFDEVE